MKSIAKFATAALLIALLAGPARHASAWTGTAETLTLKSVVQVAGDEVTLGDLVASGSAASAGAIEICHTPDAGSVRLLSLAAVAAVLKKSNAAFFLRGPEQINVMRAGRKITGDDLKPLIEAALIHGNAAAKVGEVQIQAAIYVADLGALRLRKLRFDTAVHKYRAWFVSSDAPHAVSFEAMATVEEGAVPLNVSMTKTEQAPAASSLLAHRGERAAMELAGEGFAATLVVICLENGALAKTIRVREPATKRIYRAQITGQGTLRAVSREN